MYSTTKLLFSATKCLIPIAIYSKLFINCLKLCGIFYYIGTSGGACTGRFCGTPSLNIMTVFQANVNARASLTTNLCEIFYGFGSWPPTPSMACTFCQWKFRSKLCVHMGEWAKLPGSWFLTGLLIQRHEWVSNTIFPWRMFSENFCQALYHPLNLNWTLIHVRV